MPNGKGKVIFDIKTNFYFKIKLALISVLQNETWLNNFLSDIQQNPLKYMKVEQRKWNN